MAFEPFNSVGGYTIGIPPTPVINENGVATLNGLQVSGLSNLGSVGNVIILGGDNGYFLQTDGEGRLTWAPGGNGGGGNGTPGGSNTQVQFNDEGNFGGDAGFTYDSTTNILSVSGNIVANNFTGSGNIVIARITANGNVTANYFIGNGSQLTGIAATSANFANFAGNVTVAAQPNITSLGTLTSLSVSGNVTANYFFGNGALLTGIANSNYSPLANFANYAGNVTVSNQPNITSLGTLTTVTVSGNANIANLAVTQFTNNLIPSTNITYDIGNTTRRWKDLYLSGNTIYIGNTTITATSDGISINGGNGNVTAENLTDVPAANVIGQVSNALVSSTVYTNAQPNITSVGTLTSVTVTGNANVGNLLATGNVVGSNVTANQYLTALNANLTGAVSLGGAVSIGALGSLTSLSNVNFNSSPNITLGTVSNIHISGGVSGYFLRTDGAGNLSWAVGGGGGGNGTPGGNTTEVQFNDNGVFGASANFTFNPFSYVLAVPTINTTTVSVGNTLTVNTTANMYNVNLSGVLTANSNVNMTSSPNINLGSVSNLHIQGGTNGYVLATDGAGNLSWTAGGGGGGNGTPGGSNTQIQYNDAGAFGGSAYLTFNEATTTFQIAGNLIANSAQLGAGIYQFSTQYVYFATTSSTSTDQLLWSVEAANVSGVDFHIISTDIAGSTRQSAKISTVVLGNSVVWNEFGSLQINGGTGSFSVVYEEGSIITPSVIKLLVTPDSANSTTYKMMITEYAP
jgi:hypothetical protein